MSEIDREGLVAIKPSGVDYDVMTVDDIVIADLQGNRIWGDKKPSSDTPIHLVKSSIRRRRGNQSENSL